MATYEVRLTSEQIALLRSALEAEAEHANDASRGAPEPAATDLLDREDACLRLRRQLGEVIRDFEPVRS